MKIKYEGAPAGIFRIKVPPKLELVFNDGICEVEETIAKRLLVSHPEYKQVIEKMPDPVESKEQVAPEKAKVGRPAKKIEEIPIGEQEAIKDFVKQI
jgi:hypothetical protein